MIGDEADGGTLLYTGKPGKPSAVTDDQEFSVSNVTTFQRHCGDFMETSTVSTSP